MNVKLFFIKINSNISNEQMMSVVLTWRDSGQMFEVDDSDAAHQSHGWAPSSSADWPLPCALSRPSSRTSGRGWRNCAWRCADGWEWRRRQWSARNPLETFVKIVIFKIIPHLRSLCWRLFLKKRHVVSMPHEPCYTSKKWWLHDSGYKNTEGIWLP